MKRPWSYDDDLDRDGNGGGGGERARRRFYLKVDERRRRVEHEADGSGSGSGSSSGLGLAYDRRRSTSSGFEKHRGGGGGGGGSSFTSGLKRDFFPKGFRSERGDRHRRDGSNGGGGGMSSSWRRFGGGVEEELESLNRGSKRDSREHRESVRSRENCSSGERSVKREDEVKGETRKESSSSSEMEEGELEPEEPMQESAAAAAEAKKSATTGDGAREDREVGSTDDQSEAISEKKGHFQGDNLESFGKDTCRVETVGISGEKAEPERAASSEETEADKLCSGETDPGKLSADELTREGEGENKVELESSQKEDEPHVSDNKEPLREDGKEEKETDGTSAAVLVVDDRPKDDPVQIQIEQAGTNSPERGAMKSPERGSADVPEKCAANLLGQTTEEVVGENNCEDNNTLNLLANKPSYQEKGKGLAVELEAEVEGSTCRGFDLMFRSEPRQNGGVNIKDDDDEKMKMDKLDLSLGLPGISVDCQNSKIRPNSPPQSHMRSVQSLPSASFTASVSFSGSQFVHNPSCSLNQNSLENLEQSVKSRPLFQPVEQIINGVPTTVWQPKITDEVKKETGNVAKAPLLQRNNSSLNKAASLARNSSFSSRLSSDEHSRDRRQLLKSESHSFNNRAGVIEKVISKIVYEPLHLTGRMLQEMKENSVSYLKHAICEIVTSAEKRSHVASLQEALHRRSDLTIDTLSKCPRVLLEMLLVLKTGLTDYIKRSSAVSTSDLVEIFLNNKCRNLDCRSVVPVDDCECKVCKNRHGFCSMCMCILCGNFDLASNTCSWVGCDVCLHWCHTECGLRNLLIRPGGGENQMQFYCLACGHPSEMFGFVKEVFKTCAKEWKVEVLARELRFVRKIFGSSEDTRGRRLRDLVGQMLSRLEDGADRAEVVRFILGFFADAEINATKVCSTVVPQKEPPRIITKDVSWLPQTNVEKKPATDELDRLVKLKQAEAKLYQERADDARKESEGLRQIILAKSARIDEEYSNRIAKLKLQELEQKHKRKQEELQSLERDYKQFFGMKVRMGNEIRDLMMKMETAKCNFR